jgi:nicotinamide-nucleotide amidase
MKIEMICTGEEVLAGQIVDTNAAWLGNCLMEKGFEMSRRTTVGDRLDDLVEVFHERSQYADIILVNGGLGPTADDLSALAMAHAMDLELIENVTWSDHLKQWFAKRNITLSPSNLKQALLPEGAVMVDNPVGTACGFRVKYNRAWLFFTPGVPHEFKRMVDDEFVPFVESLHENSNTVKVTKLLTLGMGESSMAEALEPLNWPEGITLGYRSYMPYLELKLIGRNVSEQAAATAIEQAERVLGDSVVAHHQETLAAEVHRLLVDSGKTLAIAESLTGGMISNQLVAFAGSSRYLKQGIVSYCNDAKMKLLNVSQNTIIEKSEVSQDCVAQMAAGAAKILEDKGLSTDFAIATSGMAGPASDADTLPVGTVVIGVKCAEQVICQTLRLSSDRSRQYIRELTTAVALDMLRRAILGMQPLANYGYINRVDEQCYTFN